MKCSIDGCVSDMRTKNMCNAHYLMSLRYGRINKKYVPTDEQISFMCKSLTVDEIDCIIWPYYSSTSGYPRIFINGKCHNVHRLLCESINGQPLVGEQARHICGNGMGGCINPKHLQWGSRSDNEMDKQLHNTDNRGVRNGMNKLSEKDAKFVKNSMSRRNEAGFCSELASMFSVSENTIRAIWNGYSWKWL